MIIQEVKIKKDLTNEIVIKSTILQELKTFSSSSSVKKNRKVLTKFLRMMTQGADMSEREATDAFFAITKLFQLDDFILRKLVYVALKLLAPIAKDVIIITSSITRDMIATDDEVKSSAIRTLYHIIDVSMIQSVDRYLKQSIVSRVPFVATAALVCSYKLGGPEIARRWINEAQEAIASNNDIVTFHAIGFIYSARKHDKLSIQKILQKFKGNLRSPIALCYLIRVAYTTIICNIGNDNTIATSFLESCLRNSNEMVSYEAARNLIKVQGLDRKQTTRVINVFQSFLTSSNVIHRFCVVTALNKIAEKFPEVVSICNIDLENLISDENRSISTLAITTLLKTGSETSVDRLMKKITSSLSDLSDEFKVVLVKSIRTLFTKFPRKHKLLIFQLARLLREQGGVAFKTALVETLMSLVVYEGPTKYIALSHLCEFIEDCEHTQLAIRVLRLLGVEGPKAIDPALYIRFIYNRMLLENAQVRRVVVHVLARFGASCEKIRPSIITLLNRCLLDTDDCVRDKATMYIKVLDTDNVEMFENYIFTSMPQHLLALELQLVNYLKSKNEEPFTVSQVFEEESIVVEKSDKKVIQTTVEKNETSNDEYMTLLLQQPFINSCGNFFKSSKASQLTEAETEYLVVCVKHIFENNIIVEFRVSNTIDLDLRFLSILLTCTSDSKVSNRSECIESIQPGETKVLYNILPVPQFTSCETLEFSVSIQFTIDPELDETCSNMFEEYDLEAMQLNTEDYIKKKHINVSFQDYWNSLSQNEHSEMFDLTSLDNMAHTITTTMEFFPLTAVENSDQFDKNTKSHVLKLVGTFHPDCKVAIIAEFECDDDSISLNLRIRSESDKICEALCNVIC